MRPCLEVTLRSEILRALQAFVVKNQDSGISGQTSTVLMQPGGTRRQRTTGTKCGLAEGGEQSSSLLFHSSDVLTLKSASETARISKLTGTNHRQSQISDCTDRTGSGPPYPSESDGGHDTVGVGVHSTAYVPLGNSGGSARPVAGSAVSNADPAHAPSSRSRRGHAAGRPVGCL
jgi:hypothetical protein